MDIRFSENSSYKVENVGFLRVVRPANYRFEYKTGKKDIHSFMWKTEK